MTLTTYDRSTTHSRNPLAAFAHRVRGSRALNLVLSRLPEGGAWLDYGAGPGRLLQQVRSARPDAQLYALEPFSTPGSGYVNLTSAAQCEGKTFDVITAFEVLEHVFDEGREEFFSLVRDHLAPGREAVISVPIMLGPVIFLKAFNASFVTRNTSWRYSLKEVLAAALLLRSPPRQLSESYMYGHKGYDWRVTRKQIAEEFEIVHEECGPFPALPWGFNSQWFCVFRRKL